MICSADKASSLSSQMKGKGNRIRAKENIDLDSKNYVKASGYLAKIPSSQNLTKDTVFTLHSK